MMRTLTAQAPAKINLALHVGAVRADGFHEIDSLVARIGLYDTLTITTRDDGRLTLACDDPTIPADDSNLVLKAARRLRECSAERRATVGADIRLCKRIPAGGGLGGGSSDAATTLLLLNDLWGLGRSHAELADLGAALGSDVPLFLHAPLCRVRGRGERVEDVRRRLDAWVTLILPQIHCPTAAVYQAFDTLREAGASAAHREIDAILGAAALAPDRLMDGLFNDLEPAAFAVSPALAQLARQIRRKVAAPLLMTGSGSALFRLFASATPANGYAEAVRARFGVRVEVVPLLTTPASG